MSHILEHAHMRRIFDIWAPSYALQHSLWPMLVTCIFLAVSVSNQHALPLQGIQLCSKGKRVPNILPFWS